MAWVRVRVKLHTDVPPFITIVLCGKSRWNMHYHPVDTTALSPWQHHCHTNHTTVTLTTLLLLSLCCQPYYGTVTLTPHVSTWLHGSQPNHTIVTLTTPVSTWPHQCHSKHTIVNLTTPLPLWPNPCHPDQTTATLTTPLSRRPHHCHPDHTSTVTLNTSLSLMIKPL